MDYGARFGLDEENCFILWDVIAELDAVYLKWKANQKPKPEAAPVRPEEKPVD